LAIDGVCDVSCVWRCSIQNLVYCTQNINNYELVHGAADYHINSISQYSNSVLVKFICILEFKHFKHSNLGSVIPNYVLGLYSFSLKKNFPETAPPSPGQNM